MPDKPPVGWRFCVGDVETLWRWRADFLTSCGDCSSIQVAKEAVSMHYVVLGVHSAEVCPVSNAKSKALLLEMGPQIPKIAEKLGVKILAGPYVNREHLTVTIVETDRAEALDDFLVESRLHQWNTVRIIPSHPMEVGMKEIAEGTDTLF
jgi:hypothetical protein